jgi:hypothetical protein
VTRHTTTIRRALAIGLASAVLLIGAPANAAATTFNADVKDQLIPSEHCADGADLCAAAELPGYGHADWTLTLVALAPPTRPCRDLTPIADFEALSRFTLADGSTLTLTEGGTACAPGASAFTEGGLHSYGNPRSWTARWTVHAATGRFADATGTGSETGASAGAHLSASYTGILTTD